MPISPSNNPTRKYTTISIPTPLFQQVEKKIEQTGFRSATEFIVYVTRVAIAEDAAGARPEDPAARLRRSIPDAGGPGNVREEVSFR